MTTPHVVMWAVVGLIGLPAAYRNPTALALSASWLAGEITWLATGNNLPLSTYIMADIAVIAIMYAKAIVRVGPKTYPTPWSQIKGFILDLTVWDRCVLGLFLLGAWPVYLSGIHPYYQWWALYYITAAQFLFAGAEPVANWYMRRQARRWSKGNNVLKFAPAYSRVKRYLGAEPPPSYRSVNRHRMRGEGRA